MNETQFAEYAAYIREQVALYGEYRPENHVALMVVEYAETMENLVIIQDYVIRFTAFGLAGIEADLANERKDLVVMVQAAIKDYVERTGLFSALHA